MATQSAFVREPFVDDEPTTLDLNPWHEESGTYDVDEPTLVRPVPHLVASCALARPPTPRRAHEPIEALSLPAGVTEDMLPVGAPPESALQMRIAIIRVARELGRDYRAWYGATLGTDAASIERIQGHLLGYAAEVVAGRMDARTLAPELVRHGVLLGEILARTLDAAWVDLSGEQPGAWLMMVPPGRIVSPVGQVHRFLLERNREQDLVGFFLDLMSEQADDR